MVDHVTPSEEAPLLVNRNGDNRDISSSPANSLWKDSSLRQKALLLFIFWGHFAIFLCVSTPNPFMTKAIVAKGGLEIEASILLQITMLAMAISSVVFGKYQVHINSKVLLLAGLLCFSACQASFGLLHFAENLNTVVAVGITIRVLQGIGQGAYLVAALTIICQEFTAHIGKVFGMAESLLSIGYISGPMLGGVLYNISRTMLLPFVISSGIVVPMIPVGYCLLRGYREIGEDDQVDVMGSILKPGPVFIVGAVAIGNGQFGLINVLGCEYMLNRGFTMVEVGSALLTAAGSYGVMAVITGCFVDVNTKIRRAFFAIGFIGLCIFQLVFSPTQTTTGIFIGMVLCGVLSAFEMICGFSELMNLAAGENNLTRSDFALHSALSGVWNLAVGIGGFSFPLVGSQLSNVMSYRLVTITATAVGVLSLGFVTVLMLLVGRRATNSAPSRSTVLG